MDRYDLVILGSGSAAFAAALRGAELEAEVAMLEHDTIGGTCVNRGCIPSKNLIQAAKLLHHARHSPFPGLELQGEVDFPKLIAQKDELVERLRQEKYVEIAEDDSNIEIIEGKARFIDPHHVQADGKVLASERFIIATGARPSVPPIEGLDQVDYLTSRTAFELQELPEALVIVGGGYIAVELGQLFQRLGSQVTILERGPRVLRGFEPVISHLLQGILEEEGLRIETGAEVRRVRRDGANVAVAIRRAGGKFEVRGTHLLLATGRQPNTDGLGLEAIGVSLDERGFIRVDDGLRTSVEGIWAAGDVIGPPLATPVGAREGTIAAENALLGKHRKMDYHAIPRAVFTDPEVGSVGLTEEEAEREGIECECRVLDLKLVPKAAAIREAAGLVKLVAEAATGRALGVHLLVPRGAEIIHEGALAVKLGLRVSDLIELIHVYPTISEALRMVAQSFTKDVSRLSCCAE